MHTSLIARGLYRIPALVWDQGLITLFDARLSVDDLPAPIDLVSSTSPDGFHWATPKPAIVETKHRGVGDACLVTGDLCFHGLSNLAGFFEDPTDLEPRLARREEHGWASKSIASLFADVDAAFASSGTGLVLADGRWIQSFVVRRGRQISLRIVRSDGHVTDIDGGNESAMTQLPNGRIVLHSRGVGNRLSSVSDDFGETFSPLEVIPELVDPGCNGHVFYWKAARMLAATHLADPHLRRHLVVDLSTDFGATWTHRITIEREEAAYSTAVEMPNGDVAVVWEAEGTRAIKCTVISVNDIEPRVDKPIADAVSLRHVVINDDHDGIEVALPDPSQWGEGVFKIVSNPDARTQKIRTRGKPARQSLEIGDELVFDIRARDEVRYGVTVAYDGRSIDAIKQEFVGF
ncbi:putative exo-alpha-sialidase [Corynebacterium suranareeae]|uniref:exo-alpha-sialidase n=1 Tax=Corynebacterium suranareeae TaxID=2506452 RepID=A0A160PT93_9CORY|nr:sialidase family protein [Corynebacterium suranareeae]BAU96996.1 putative exo-alpha-sialidase [Corynebacterium suranareeae]